MLAVNQVSEKFGKNNAIQLKTGCVHCLVVSINHVSVKVLDLSHNNISFISNRFFKPAELSLLELRLGFNEILKATRDVFGNMVNLQRLDLSHNRIFELEQDTFKYTKKLQVLLSINNCGLFEYVFFVGFFLRTQPH